MGAFNGWFKRANRFAATTRSIAETIFAVLTVSFRSASTPFFALREEDEEKKSRQVVAWRENKLRELRLVGVLGALIASAVTASFSWGPITDIPTATIACWYSALLLALTAVGSATQQAIVLSRLAILTDSLLRKLLTPDITSCHNKSGPGFLRVFVWQVPIIFLSACIAAYVVGILILAFSTGHILITVVVGIVVLICLLGYGISTIFLDYYTAQAFDLEAQQIQSDLATLPAMNPPI